MVEHGTAAETVSIDDPVVESCDWPRPWNPWECEFKCSMFSIIKVNTRTAVLVMTEDVSQLGTMSVTPGETHLNSAPSFHPEPLPVGALLGL